MKLNKMKVKQLTAKLLLIVILMIILITAFPAYAVDPLGTCTVFPTTAVAGSTDNKLTFTFTASGTMDGGAITIEMPTGWSAPQGTDGIAGYTTATSTGNIGTPSFDLQVVTVPITTLPSGGTITVVYGDTTGGTGSEAIAQTALGTATFVTMSKISAYASLAEIAESPKVIVEGIELDSDYYHTGDTVMVTVCDGSENDDPIRRETVIVKAKSTTDIVGIAVTLTETGVDTGIFVGSFPLVSGEPGLDELGVSEDDTITVTYLGYTATAFVDDTPPVFTDVTGEEYYKNTDSITLTATLDEAGYTLTADFSAIDSEYSLGDEVPHDIGGGTYTITYTLSEDNTMADGEYTIPVTAEDLAGNLAAYMDFSTTLDNTAPTVSEPSADPYVIQPATETTVTFTASVSDELSEVASVTIDLTAIDGSASQTMTEIEEEGEGTGVYEYEWTGTVDLEDDYELPITATDGVGNVNDEVSIILQVIDDTEGPTDVSFTEARPIRGGLVVKGLSAEDPLSGVKEYEVYVGETLLETITVEDLASTDMIDLDWALVYKGTFVLALGEYIDKTVEVTVVAVDYAGNEADPVTLYAGEVSEGMWIPVPLFKGWNLISLPLIPDSPARGDILSLILDQGASGVIVSYSYDQYIDDWITNPAEITDGYGYWLYAKNDDVLIVEGVDKLAPPSPPATYEYTAGWVLAGYKSTSSETIVDDYLASLAPGSYFKTIYVWEGHWMTLATGKDTLWPGQGFWIWMYSDQNLIPPME